MSRASIGTTALGEAFETRLTLGGAPLLLCSPLPPPQSDCPGWHCSLPTESPIALGLPDEATWGDLAASAAGALGAPVCDITLFSPRPLGVGVLCDCGHREEAVVGQVGRTACPVCSGVAAAPLSVAHTLPAALPPTTQTLAEAGLPPHDMLWATASVPPRDGWLPWVLSPREAAAAGRPRVGVVGLGALGYPTAEILARRAYALDVLDCDVVEPRNLSGSYSLAAVGKPKALAAAAFLRRLRRGVSVRAWHGDAARDVGLGVMARWAVAVLCLDRVPPKVALSGFLGLLGVPIVQGQILGSDMTALVRTYLPGRSACLQCLLDRAEAASETIFSCRPGTGAPDSGKPGLFTTPVEAHIGAGLIAAEVARLAPPPIPNSRVAVSEVRDD